MDSLDIYVRDTRVARLDRSSPGEYTFSYLPGTKEDDAVSLTMPVNEDYSDPFMIIPPALQVGFPEGALLEAIHRIAGKVLKIDDDFDVLALVGQNMVGRVRVLPQGQSPDTGPALSAGHAVSELLRSPSTTAPLLEKLIERLAAQTGLSGIFPKTFAAAPLRGPLSFPVGDAILKLETSEFPGIAIVEHICLLACRAAGIPTADSELAVNGRALLVTRFDRREDGQRLGFEDFCSLSGLPRTAKYASSMASVGRVLEMYCQDPALDTLFTMVVMNTLLRNGDAHLKNFGLVYDDPRYPALAPAYDVVSTVAWIREDQPALPLQQNGPLSWPTTEDLLVFGETICRLSRQDMMPILKRCQEAIRHTRPVLEGMRRQFPHALALERLDRTLSVAATTSRKGLGKLGATATRPSP
ncbi:MAG: type II toxin-antitoxin system HipA family toxin [Acidiferrobacter sp.]